MNISVKVETPQAGSSSFTAIASKSMAHRFLLANALTRLCGGEGAELLISTTSRDIEATRDCVSELLAPEVEGRRARFLCQESGSTFRFLLPIVGALGRRGCFVLEGRLKDRPLSPLYEEMTAHGCILSPQGTPQFLVDGRMTGGVYTIAGDISSQYITGLLFALPLAREDSEIHITGKLESRDYVEMTLKVLEAAGIQIRRTDYGFSVPGGQKYALSGQIRVEGDWSNAAVFLALGALTKGGVTCTNLDIDSAQGDKRILDVLRSFGATVTVDAQAQSVTVRQETGLRGIDLDVSDIPDLVPVMSVVAAGAHGVTHFTNASRLKLKESDRLVSVTQAITALGGQASQDGESLTVWGDGTLAGGTVCSENDHRIVMLGALAAFISSGAVCIEDAGAIAKSFPTFFDELKEGGALYGIDIREQD